MKLKNLQIKGQVEYEDTVRQLSNSGYIPCSKMFIGRKVRVIILPEE